MTLVLFAECWIMLDLFVAKSIDVGCSLLQCTIPHDSNSADAANSRQLTVAADDICIQPWHSSSSSSLSEEDALLQNIQIRSRMSTNK